jgi:hypothetical protein
MEPKNSTNCLTLLSHLLFGNVESAEPITQVFSGGDRASDDRKDRGQLWELANAHHVIMRAFSRLHAYASDWAQWSENAMATEQARIDHALSFLSPICQALEGIGDVIVIKSLDHWPDLGNDLDLYTNAKSSEVVAVMRKHFGARLDKRSWGDRLAKKWNFIVPGLPELVEVHIGRLGQTGEQVAITNSLVNRASTKQFGSHIFRVPQAENRIVISTLQRMYRHFYLRLCDIVDNALLVDTGAIDYDYLQSLAQPAGLWDGMCSYLVIVSEYVRSYRGEGLPLPPAVIRAARVGSSEITFRKKFLRIPIFPQAASFYAKEWMRLLSNGELQNTMRLSLLPGLAVAAALAFKTTGSDKGIW